MRLYVFDHEDVRRIMLVIDNFNEMVGLETLFRRLGFDVLSLSRESLVPEAILGFPADLVVALAHGRHVDGLRLGSKIRYGNTRPKLAVLLAKGQQGPDPEDREFEVDAIIETPFDAREALRVVSTLLNLEAEPILDKYEKIVSARLFEPNELKIIKHPVEPIPVIRVTSSSTAAAASDLRSATSGYSSGYSSGSLNPNSASEVPPSQTARESRYAKFLDDKAEEELPPMASSATMRDARRRLAEAEAHAPVEEQERAAQLEREKREFVRAMIEAAQDDKVSSTKR